MTIETKGLLEAMDRIRQRVHSRLDTVSPEAREEWAKLLGEVPHERDLVRGVIDVSTETLAHMIAKASRFEQILRSGRRPESAMLQQEAARGAPAFSDEP